MARVFISYTLDDAELAEELTAALSVYGHEIMSSLKLAPSSHSFLELVTEEIASSDVFLALITPRSSSNAKISEEIGMARAVARDRDLLIIPVFLEEVRSTSFLKDYQGYILHDLSKSAIESTAAKIHSAISEQRVERRKRRTIRSEIVEKIETNVHEFVGDALEDLEKREVSGRRASEVWYKIGFVSLAISIVATIFSLFIFLDQSGAEWWIVLLFSVKILVLVSLLIAVSRYSFVMGKLHSLEAQKCSDRIHAISFGKFYLRVFGADAGWPELREVFSDWNIDSTSDRKTFDSSDFDPKIMDKVVELVRAVKG